jgi:predicted polyphosphate/ATP-dependent NAD kinase
MPTRRLRRLGLIVNPLAGIGGRVGLKGSDTVEIQERALELGAVLQAETRTVWALEAMKALGPDLEITTYPGEMGEDAARRSGFEPTVIGTIQRGRTTARDTKKAARELRELNVELLLFAGGDGTARDIYDAIGDSIPVLGIPAGVKIHSAAYATSPKAAGSLAAWFLSGEITSLREAEVMDIDEDAIRAGVVSAELYGFLRIPFHRRLVQGAKAASGPSEAGSMRAIACYVVENMRRERLYIIGPGTTTRAIASELGVPKTLIGVDVVLDRRVVAADANESRLLDLLQGKPATIIVTPIGGQGYIFGRGNQQVSHEVISRVGKSNLMVVGTKEKMHSLRGRPLLVDTGDPSVDQMLTGYVRVITGYNEMIMYRVSS